MMLSRSRFWSLLVTGFVVTGIVAGSALADEGHDHGGSKSEQKIAKTLASLSPADRQAAKAQRFCPMMVRSRLGADGKPIKVNINGQTVFVCCKGCVEDAKEDGQATLKMAKKLTKASANIAKLGPSDRAAAEAQKYCAVQTDSMLGIMGPPVKVRVNGKTAFLCCGGCRAKAQSNPQATLANVEKLKKAEKGHGHGHGHGHKHNH